MAEGYHHDGRDAASKTPPQNAAAQRVSEPLGERQVGGAAARRREQRGVGAEGGGGRFTSRWHADLPAFTCEMTVEGNALLDRGSDRP